MEAVIDPVNILLGIGVYFAIKYLWEMRKKRKSPAYDAQADNPPPLVADHEATDHMPNGPYREATD